MLAGKTPHGLNIQVRNVPERNGCIFLVEKKSLTLMFRWCNQCAVRRYARTLRILEVNYRYVLLRVTCENLL